MARSQPAITLCHDNEELIDKLTEILPEPEDLRENNTGARMLVIRWVTVHGEPESSYWEVMYS